MKKRDLASLAIIGISAGLAVTGCQKQNGPRNGNPPPGGPNGNKASAAEQLGPDVQAFYLSLSPDAQKKFMQLDAQHKMMAVEMANQSCNGKNKCSGMGGCGTSQHECAGKNGCKGQGGVPIKDPNKAVEVQYNNQMGQRQKTNGNMNGGSAAGVNGTSSSSSSNGGTSNGSSSNNGNYGSSNSSNGNYGNGTSKNK